MKNDIIEDNEYEYTIHNETKYFNLDQKIYNDAKNKIKNDINISYEIPNDNDLIIAFQDNKYFIKNKINNRVILKFIIEPKIIYFWKNEKLYSSFIINKCKIFQLTKKYKMKNVYYKSQNKSYSLFSHLDSFVNNPNITEIYEKYDSPEFSEKKFNDFYQKDIQEKTNPELKINPTLENLSLIELNLDYYISSPKEHFNFVKKLNNTKINYIHPKAGYYGYNDHVNLRRFISKMGMKEYMSQEEEKKYSFPVLFTAGCSGIGKTLAMLYLALENGSKIYFDLDKLNNNFQKTINIFFNESLCAFFKGLYKNYISFKNNIMNEIHNVDNNIFCLLFLFMKYYDTNIFTSNTIFIIIDNYSVSKDKNKYLDKLIEQANNNNYYRIIVNYSLKDVENIKIITSKIINDERNFLYLNDLGANYEELDFVDQRIKKVLKKFNYLPYYYFNFIELYEDNEMQPKKIIKSIKEKLANEFKKINRIGYILSLIPCIHAIEDNNIIIDIISKIPLEFFKVEKKKLFDKMIININPMNEIIQEISDELIEESLSNLIINEFNQILNNQSIQGISYEIYLTKKIVNNKQFGGVKFEIKSVKNINNFDYSSKLDKTKNYLFYQKNFYGQNYDLLFLFKKRLIFAQISISKPLKDLKSVISSFSNNANNIKIKIKKLDYEIDTCELFFIFSPNSPSIKVSKKYFIPFIVFNPKNNKILESNEQIEIHEFPYTFNSKLQFLKNLSFIFDHFILKYNIFDHIKINKNSINDNNEYQSGKKIFKIKKIIELNKYKIELSSLKSLENICFYTNIYIIIPKNNIENIKIYKIKENNFCKRITAQEKTNKIFLTEFEDLTVGKIEISEKQTNSETKLLSKKRRSDIIKSLPSNKK